MYVPVGINQWVKAIKESCMIVLVIDYCVTHCP